MRIASGSTNGKPTPACLKGQGLDSQNKAHLHTWVGFVTAQCAERGVDQWSEQLARPAMDQLGPWTCGRLAVSPPWPACQIDPLPVENVNPRSAFGPYLVHRWLLDPPDQTTWFRSTVTPAAFISRANRMRQSPSTDTYKTPSTSEGNSTPLLYRAHTRFLPSLPIK